MKKIILVLLSIFMILSLAACSKNNENGNNDDDTNDRNVVFHDYVKESDVQVEGGNYNATLTGIGTEVNMKNVSDEIGSYKYSDFALTDSVTDFVVIRVKNYGDIVVALRGDIAPVSAANFQKLVKDGFYTDVTFHRVIKGFMIQGGGFTTSGTQKEADSIYGEFTSNGHTNNLKHIKGVLSMARTTVANSASSQFFVMHDVATHLDGDYASFGYVLAGLDVVDSIASCKVDSSNSQSPSPIGAVVIEKAFFVKPIEGTGIGSETSYKQCVHSYGDWAESKASTCTTYGEDVRVCTLCGRGDTRKKDMLVHEYENGFCKVCKAYDFISDTPAEGSSIDTSITGEGTSIDMDKVQKQIGAYEYTDFVRSESETDFVVIRVKNYGDIVLALRGDVAPETVKNFKKLVNSGFYKSLTFHRVIKDFMIQGGGFTADGTKKSADKIKGEFTANKHENNLKHILGVISMARAAAYDSASSQFFIMHSAASHLDGNYASFGYVLAGLDVLNDIAKCDVDNPGSPSPSPVYSVVIDDVFFVSPIEGTGLAV